MNQPINMQAIAAAEDKTLVYRELSNSLLLGETNDGKSIYLFENSENSLVMNEIGRLREITFRDVNEGTGKERDIDLYDNYYKQLVLWDLEDQEIVGAYRLGIGTEIFKEKGEKGFYTNTLFNFSEEFKPYLENSIELGRSFVQKKYWGSRALDYLWQGIGAYIRENPEIRYLWGPVTLSDAYPTEAKNYLLYFFKLYFGSKNRLVEAKQPFVIPSENEEALKEYFNANDYREDFKKLRVALEKYELTVPVLYKQYAEVSEMGGTEFLDFNIDPDFNNCVDSLIMVDLRLIKASKYKRYVG